MEFAMKWISLLASADNLGDCLFVVRERQKVYGYTRGSTPHSPLPSGM